MPVLAVVVLVLASCVNDVGAFPVFGDPRSTTEQRDRFVGSCCGFRAKLVANMMLALVSPWLLGGFAFLLMLIFTGVRGRVGNVLFVSQSLSRPMLSVLCVFVLPLWNACSTTKPPRTCSLTWTSSFQSRSSLRFSLRLSLGGCWAAPITCPYTR